MSSNASSIAAVGQALTHNLNAASKAGEDVERDLQISFNIAQLNYQKDKKTWQAHVAKKYAKKAAKSIAGTVIDHFTVIGSIVLEGYAAYSTDRHIDNLSKVRDLDRCSCTADASAQIEAQHCERVLMPYAPTQKGRKLTHAIIAAFRLRARYRR
jgi:hypothetical protein